MAALAQLVRSDALAVVFPLPRALVFAAHGVPLTPEWLHQAAAAIVARSLAQHRAVGGVIPPIALGDGRAATTIVAVPIPTAGEAVSVLVALRAAPPFSPPDAVPMGSAAHLVASAMRSARRIQMLEQQAVELGAQVREAEERAARRAAETVPTAARSAPATSTVPLRERFAVATSVLLLAQAAILGAALAFGGGTRVGLILAVPLVAVAGPTARSGRTALLLALLLSALTFAERSAAPLLDRPRDGVAVALATGGALVALAGVVTAALALRAGRSEAGTRS